MASSFEQRPAPPLRTLSKEISIQESVFQFENGDAHHKKIMQGVKKFWETQEYCDLELVVGKQSKAIQVHKIILVSFSDYFSGLLNPNMREGKQDSIRCFETLDAASVIKLIQYCYTGSIELSVPREKIEDLLEAADYMGIQELCPVIGEFMGKHMAVENCLDLLQCAHHFNLTDLRSKAITFAAHNYTGVSELPEFMLLPPELLTELLKDDCLIVVSNNFVSPVRALEDYVVNTILKYIAQNKDHLHLLPSLLKSTKLPLLPREKLEELQKHDLVRASTDALSVVKEAREAAPLSLSDTEGPDWAIPRRNLMLREFREYSGGGEVRPEVASFNCRDILTEHFDAYITGMKIGIRRWDARPVLGGLQVFMSTGAEPVYGMEPAECEETYEIQLAADERIIKAKVHSGWMIDQLTFYTNLGKKFGPYGGGGGSEHVPEETPLDTYGYLAGISGSIVSSQGSRGITKLKLMWGFYDIGEMRKIKGELLIKPEELGIVQHILAIEIDQSFSSGVDYSKIQINDIVIRLPADEKTSKEIQQYGLFPSPHLLERSGKGIHVESGQVIKLQKVWLKDYINTWRGDGHRFDDYEDGEEDDDDIYQSDDSDFYN